MGKKVITFMLAGILTLSAAFPTMGLQAEDSSAAATQFMDCIEPMPIIESLSSNCWGASEVGKRDQGNGLEDRELEKYVYWDGGILKDDETGKYYMFASRWLQASGHWGNDIVPDGWRRSQAIYAVSDNLYGPYEDKGPIWEDWCEGAGHNVFPFKLSESDPLFNDGYKYAIVISDTGLYKEKANGAIHIAKEVNGPWELVSNGNDGKLKAAGGFSISNISIMLRPDGKYEATNRNGDLAIADSLAGTWEVKENGLWWKVPGMPTERIEDPVIWYSDGRYHIVANKWDARRAYHITSEDGITNWKLSPGTAYTPDADFLRYTDGTVNNWKKIERPNIYVEDGKIAAMTFAVINVEKEQDFGDDQNGSKVIVVPFSSEKLTEFVTRTNPLEHRGGLLPAADTTAQSWGEENTKNYGGEMYLQLQKSSNYMGLLGEGTRPNSTYDTKIAYVKYDLSSFGISGADEVDEVYLSLVYTERPAGSAATQQIQVARADSNWQEGNGRGSVNSNQADPGTLTWDNQPSLIYNANNIENTTSTSPVFSTENFEQEVKIDVTKLVKQFVEEHPGETVLSFAMNVTVTGNTRIRIGSKEAGEGYAPKLIMPSKEPPAITTIALENGLTGKEYCQALTAESVSPVEWSVTGGSLPDGLNLSTAGIISGTPKAAGTFTFTVNAANSAGSSTKEFKITVEPRKPEITITALVNGTVGKAYSQTLTAEGDSPITWSITGGSLPDGLNISTTGVISGTPKAAGTFTFTVNAVNSAGSSTKELKITVEPQKIIKTCEKPTADKPGKTYTGSVNVTLKSMTMGARIYYTTDGKNPTTGSKYIANGKKIKISKTTTLKFMAVAEGLANSETTTMKYTIKTAKPGKKAVPASKKVKSGKKVTLKAPKGVTLYYTRNGKKPTAKTKTKVKPGKKKQITVTKKTTIRVIAVKKGCGQSAVVKRTYKVK